MTNFHMITVRHIRMEKNAFLLYVGQKRLQLLFSVLKSSRAVLEDRPRYTVKDGLDDLLPLAFKLGQLGSVSGK
ncbi:hypothetical protein [Neorhizobium galegae]|uniref:hypothetical protein n=1 Tax=Neorhizobium galegae TaxID=399 RepID=UPI002104A696|nr:hypothetical protein [Neorhizobium galegae]MCQ1835155.1 hypothetical protein [Neorhizobium galegae]UIY29127.1 hypothetical protein LZK73_21470 [Neorhizobium galegae]